MGIPLAKALGNGMPISACWARRDVAAAFKPGDHATTFGGQPLAARAALAVLDVMEQENVPRRAQEQGKRLMDGLRALPRVVDVRGVGLLVAAELAEGIVAGDVAATCLERGLVLNAVTPTSLRLAPPLLVTDADIDTAIGILRGVLTP